MALDRFAILEGMEREVRLIDTETVLDELVYEPAADPGLNLTVGLVLESLRHREPERTIQ